MPDKPQQFKIKWFDKSYIHTTISWCFNVKRAIPEKTIGLTFHRFSFSLNLFIYSEIVQIAYKVANQRTFQRCINSLKEQKGKKLYTLSEGLYPDFYIR